jgi:hypothetical protein
MVRLSVSDSESGLLEIRVRGKKARSRIPYAEGGSDRDLNGLLRLRGGVAGPPDAAAEQGCRVVYGGRRDACVGAKLQHFYTGLQSPIPGAREQASATVPGYRPRDYPSQPERTPDPRRPKGVR